MISEVSIKWRCLEKALFVGFGERDNQKSRELILPV